ncbi:MAG: FAS1-like dehydratase domain-containing protein [Novosphingobium sp.]
MSDWSPWIGREERSADRVEPMLFSHWHATFSREISLMGTAPQGFHWCLCTPLASTDRLGPDGHPRRDDSADSFLPPIPLPRRMWAASSVEFVQPLRPGDTVSRTSRVAAVSEKDGGSGKLVFVEVVHETSTDAGLAVREVQSLVYREAAAEDAAPVPPPLGDGAFDAAAWDADLTIVPSEALLFRFSALTFNSHRIHYDLPYATGIEGYRGLVVHGPLTATLLLDLAARELGDSALKSFAFRGVSPAICGEPLHIAMRGSGAEIVLGAFASDGREVMKASASA